MKAVISDSKITDFSIPDPWIVPELHNQLRIMQKSIIQSMKDIMCEAQE